MIIFLGDSFTWGQGLYFEKWLDEGRTVEFCNQHMPPDFPQENMSHEDDLYRRTYHYPNLVAKHFNKSYVTKWGNGGSNLDISNILKNIRSQIYYPNGVDFVIIQFTDFTRPDSRPEYDWETYYTKFSSIEDLIKNQVEEIAKSLTDVPWFCFSWLPEIGNYIESNYPENFVPLIIKNKSYNNFKIMSEHDEFLLTNYKLNDAHFNKLGHQIIADSLITRIK